MRRLPTAQVRASATFHASQLMTHDQILAAGFAAIAMGIPIAIALWTIADARKAWGSAPTASSVGFCPPNSRASRLAWTAYLTAVGLATVWVAFSVLTADASSRESAKALILFLLAAGLVALAPMWPLFGPCAYILVSYAMPREDAITALLFNAHSESLLTILSAAALVPWSRQSQRRLAPPRSDVAGALALFTFWVGVVVVAALWNGHPIGDGLVHRTERVIQCLVLFLVAYYSRPTVAEVQILVAALAAMVAVRAVRFSSNFHLEQNLAALAAILVPWAIALPFSLKRWWSRVASIPIALGLIALIVFIANRGAFLGLAGGAVAVWATTRWKWRSVAASAPAFLLFALLLPKTTLGKRLDEAYQEGGFQESAAARLELWGLGVDFAQQHPLFGLGPGNYTQYFNEFYHVEWNIAAHNMFVDIVAETGFPGLVIFAAIWYFATAALVRSRSRIADRPTRCLVMGGFASIWVYLVTGSFLSLASLAFIYILVGLSLAIAMTGESVVSLPSSSRPSVSDRLGNGTLTRHDLDIAALLYTCLAVLGSLTPFKFEPVGLTAASERFLELHWWPTGHISPVDVASNVALFVPLGFLVMGSLTCDISSGAKPLAAAVATLLGCVGIGAAIEYSQCWFPSRTVSAQDVMAQLVGAAVGCGLWLCIGQFLVDRWRRWRADRVELSPLQKVILAYAALLLIWGGWPLSITLHPVELWGKYQEGYIRPFGFSDYLTPFTGGSSSIVARFLLAAPLGWFLSSAWLKKSEPWRSWRHAVPLAFAAAVGIETLRLMAQGQTATVDQCLLTFAAILFGCVVHRRSPKLSPAL